MFRKLRTITADWLRKRLLAHEITGTRVLSSRWPTSVQTVDAGGGRTVSFAGAGGVFGELRLAPVEGKDTWRIEQKMHGNRVFESAHMSTREALALYREMLQQLLANAPGVSPAGASATFRWTALALALVALLVWAPSPLSSHPGAGVAAGVTAATATPVVAAPERDQAAPRVNPAELVMLRTAAGRGGVNLAEGGKAFYVFSDPKCPYCQQLERTLEQLGTGYRPVILPVAYKEGAKEVAQAVLCAREPKAATRLWRQALASPDEPVKGGTKATCSEGAALLNDNMTLFEMLKLTGTPTVITPTGRMFSGSSSATVEQLRAALELP
ncbi:MAG: hypothetical protein K0Q43_171 [Ramlibacter sp.]|jgi:hypothetical protein|nr:hypothetical protein [Ramlibacter sp.]